VGTVFTLFVVPMFYTLISHPDAEPEPGAVRGEGDGEERPVPA